MTQAHKLQNLLGRTFRYLSSEWTLIEILDQEDRVVLQNRSAAEARLQTNQYGFAQRRVAETISLPISAPGDADSYSEEMLLLLRGHHHKVDNKRS